MIDYENQTYNLSLFHRCHADCVKTAGIKDVFVLCEHGELRKYRVPTLLKDMEASRLIIHHHPFPDGEVPTIETFLPVLHKLSENIKDGTKTLVQ